GVPDEVLKDLDVAYDEAWLAKCIDQNQRNEVAKWDENGNLLT
ncbi:MAG: gluconate 2-dehydrogenase subunit 3 family protein, partial [Flavobacteriaceae bacterium]|nr:gluconate 2-dehydrogenase subunit 3 family protein [Flavobacteriaceae bacterium]